MKSIFNLHSKATKGATNLALGTATFVAFSLASASAATPPLLQKVTKVGI